MKDIQTKTLLDPIKCIHELHETCLLVLHHFSTSLSPRAFNQPGFGFYMCCVFVDLFWETLKKQPWDSYFYICCRGVVENPIYISHNLLQKDSWEECPSGLSSRNASVFLRNQFFVLFWVVVDKHCVSLKYTTYSFETFILLDDCSRSSTSIT